MPSPSIAHPLDRQPGHILPSPPCEDAGLFTGATNRSDVRGGCRYPVDTEPGDFRRLDLSETTEGLHVLGVTANGLLLHQLRVPAAPGMAIFRDVELVGVGQDVGFFTAVACG